MYATYINAIMQQLSINRSLVFPRLLSWCFWRVFYRQMFFWLIKAVGVLFRQFEEWLKLLKYCNVVIHQSSVAEKCTKWTNDWDAQSHACYSSHWLYPRQSMKAQGYSKDKLQVAPLAANDCARSPMNNSPCCPPRWKFHLNRFECKHMKTKALTSLSAPPGKKF